MDIGTIRSEQDCSERLRLRGDEFRNLTEYKRYAFTDTGVSPIGVPGDAKHLVVADSDEHDEEGHIIEDAETRIKMVQKRFLKKMPLIRKEIASPLLYGNREPEIVMVGWGSTYGVMKEVVDSFQKAEALQCCISVRFIRFRRLRGSII